MARGKGSWLPGGPPDAEEDDAAAAAGAPRLDNGGAWGPSGLHGSVRKLVPPRLRSTNRMYASLGPAAKFERHIET